MRAGLSLITAVLLAVFLLPGIAQAEPSELLSPVEGEQVVIGEQPDGIRFWFREPSADTWEIDILVSRNPHVDETGRLDGGIDAFGFVNETPTPGYVSWTLPADRYTSSGGDVDLPPGVYYWQTDALQCAYEDQCHVYSPVQSFQLTTERTQAKPPNPPGTTGTSTAGERTPVAGPPPPATPVNTGFVKKPATKKKKSSAAKKRAAARKKAAARRKAKRCRTLLKQKKRAKAKKLGCKVPKAKKRAAKRS